MIVYFLVVNSKRCSTLEILFSRNDCIRQGEIVRDNHVVYMDLKAHQVN